MGRILITNSQEWNSNLRECFKQTGLQVNFFDQFMTVYRKRNINNDNFFCNNNDIVVCTGTWSYKGKQETEGLELLYHDIEQTDVDIREIRKNLVGTYCCTIKKNDIIYMFVDETHTYALYYYSGKDGFLITNTYYHIQKCTRQEIDKDLFKVIAAKTGLSSNKTLYKNIFRLLEEEYLEINIAENKMDIKKCQLNTTYYKFNNLEEVVECLSKEIEKIGDNVFCKTGKKFLFTTGGVDSRIRLALDRFLNKDVILGYWGGNNVITNGTIEDRRVNNIIADKFDMKTYFFDVSSDFVEDIDNISIARCDKYGEYVTIYSHNDKWLDIFDNMKDIDTNIQEIELGYDPDLIREIDTIDNSYTNNYSVDDLINSSFLRSGLFKRLFECVDINKLICNDISNQIDKVDINKITISDAVNIFNYARLDMGCHITNLCNEYYYCFNLLYSKSILDIVHCIPYNYLKDSRLAILLINKWCKELLEVPIFSHNHYIKYNVRKGLLQKSKSHAFLSWLKPKVINSFLYDKIYVKYIEKRIFPESSNSDILFDECIKILKKSTFFANSEIRLRRHISRKGFDLSALARFVALVRYCEVTAKNDE